MLMTGLEIQAAARQYADFDITDTETLAAINEGILWIAPYAELYNSTVIDVPDATQQYTLPDDAIAVVEVKNNDGYNITNCITRGGMITFPDTGTYTVLYKAIPVTMSSLTEEPSIHSIYHSCLATYVAAWWKMKYDETNQDGARLIVKFERDVIMMHNALRGKHFSTEVKVFR